MVLVGGLGWLLAVAGGGAVVSLLAGCSIRPRGLVRGGQLGVGCPAVTVRVSSRRKLIAVTRRCSQALFLAMPR